MPYCSSPSASLATSFFGAILAGSSAGSGWIERTGVGGVERFLSGDKGNGGSSAGSSSTKLRNGWTESWSMLRLRTRLYKEGRAFRRGLRPTFINPHV